MAERPPQWDFWTRCEPEVRNKTLCPCESGVAFLLCHGTVPLDILDTMTREAQEMGFYEELHET
jgi:hypothetical protein